MRCPPATASAEAHDPPSRGRWRGEPTRPRNRAFREPPIGPPASPAVRPAARLHFFICRIAGFPLASKARTTATSASAASRSAATSSGTGQTLVMDPLPGFEAPPGLLLRHPLADLTLLDEDRDLTPHAAPSEGASAPIHVAERSSGDHLEDQLLEVAPAGPGIFALLEDRGVAGMLRVPRDSGLEIRGSLVALAYVGADQVVEPQMRQDVLAPGRGRPRPVFPRPSSNGSPRARRDTRRPAATPRPSAGGTPRRRRRLRMPSTGERQRACPRSHHSTVVLDRGQASSTPASPAC